MRSVCDFCYGAISLMGEIGGSESEPLDPIYADLHKVLLIETCLWAIAEPQDDVTILARNIHAALHRVLLHHVDRILAQAKAEVRKRALEYGVNESEVSDWIQDLIRILAQAKDEVRKRALEYGVDESEVSDWIHDLIRSVARASGRKP
jgi:hypothetical protein